MSSNFENVMEQAEECKRQYKELRKKQICKKAFYTTACAAVGGAIGCVLGKALRKKIAAQVYEEIYEEMTNG